MYSYFECSINSCENNVVQMASLESQPSFSCLRYKKDASRQKSRSKLEGFLDFITQPRMDKHRQHRVKQFCATEAQCPISPESLGIAP
jgi:hypothetical protein